MYGVFIGDTVGSKYEFRPIKTKDFPLFSPGCDYTDDTIMTVAVAKAIMTSREEQFHSGKRCFREILIETMQDFGRRYPNPTGAYGGHFAQWLREPNPQPYQSYGNGSAMRVAPCGLAAVSLEEALMLARISAIVSHDHPEGIRGAEAVAAAVYLAKTGKSKDEIRQYIEEHYYKLAFTLNQIRPTYRFDGSCQGSVPQAIVAFLESDCFEDAIRNVISIGGDCDTTGAITGAIAWTYYTVQAEGYSGWANEQLPPDMRRIRELILPYLPQEFIDIAGSFHEVCWQRAGTAARSGFCTRIASKEEEQTFYKQWTSPFQPPVVPAEKCVGPAYTLQYLLDQALKKQPHRPGCCEITHDVSLAKWRLTIQLEEKRYWFLSVFLHEDGAFDRYSLDYEGASDSHYEFVAEDKVRALLYRDGDEKHYLHELLIRHIRLEGDTALENLLKPFITARFHY